MTKAQKARYYNPPIDEQYAKGGEIREERDAYQALKYFVTDARGSIYAMTPLVPELFSALLKARYSRTELSARQLLWREFVTNKENIHWKKVEEGMDILSDVFNYSRAEGVAERILLQYGDDSVFELAGGHLFLDRISMVASKIVEDARIGLSPLEKSTRYVVFDQKDNAGDYSYFKDPAIMESKHRDLYVTTMRDCFNLYAKAVLAFADHFKKEISLEKQEFPDLDNKDKLTPFAKLTSDKSIKAAKLAYNFSIRSKACDTARVLLPAATLTNVGEFGNARAYGYLFTKMRVSDLAEAQMIAEEGVREMKKVLPKFLDVVDNAHGKGYQEYLEKTDKLMKKRAQELLNGIAIEEVERVTLVKLDKNPEINIAAALLYPYSQLPLQQVISIVKKAGESVAGDILRDSLRYRMNRRHKPPRAYEIAGYELVYDILGNFGIYRDLHRQRQVTQQRQQYSVTHGYDMPIEFSKIGLDKEFEKLMGDVAAAHAKINKDFPIESQYLTTLGHYTRWYVGLNLRSAFWFTELRSVPQGHFSYRTIAQDMFLKAKKVYPFLKELKPMKEEYVDMADRRENLERMEAMQRIQAKLAQIEGKYGG